MEWEGTGQQSSEHFYTAPVEIQSIKIRYISELDYILLGVLMVDGTFEVLEVRRSEEERFVYKSVYKENLKTLDPRWWKWLILFINGEVALTYSKELVYNFG